MATKEDIITLPNDILRKVSKKVKKVDKEITDLIGSMTAVSLDWEASRDFEVCVGLAAEPYSPALPSVRVEPGSAKALDACPLPVLLLRVVEIS